MRTQPNLHVRSSIHRRGAVLPLFALMLPVLIILCGLAVNIAYLQLVSTEMKVATDAAAHAGGRALSILQTTEDAYEYVARSAATNSVGGQPLGVIMTEDYVQFGKSVRSNNGYGRYEFTQIPANSNSTRITSLSVLSTMDIPLIFGAIPGVTQVPTSRRSTVTQVDRDIALVLDRSGSMLYFKDEELLNDTLYTLYTTYETIDVPGYWRWSWRWGYYWVNGYSYQQRMISKDEYNRSQEFLYYRSFSDNVISKLQPYGQEMRDYTYDWRYSNNAPRYSRWYFLKLGVDAFLDVLDYTDQVELCSLVTFATSAALENSLESTYDGIRNRVNQLSPYGSTAIGEGLETGLPPIVSGSAARPFAAKTIVVLTDGISNTGTDPVTAVANILGDYNVTVHTVTFTRGSDQATMQRVAEIGGGRHYHAEEGDELVQIFEEIANNLPTILTQ